MQHRTDNHGSTLRLSTLFLTLLILVITFTPACSSQAAPQAELRASISTGQVPLRVSFINDSKNASEFQWDFGDGSTMTTTNAGQIITHEYTEVGTHTVRLTAIANGDSPQTSTAEISIAVEHGPIDYVKLVPDSLELACQQTQQLSAEVFDEYGNLITEAQLAWKINDSRAGTINSDGVFTAGTRAGRYAKGISVTSSLNNRSIQMTVPVTVIPGPLDRIKLSPSTLELAAGQSHQFIAEATDAYNNPLPEAELTWKATPNLGTITSSGMFTAGTQTGVFSQGVTVSAELNNSSADATSSVTVIDGSSGTDNTTPPVSDNGTGELVTFKDENFETTIRVAIGKPEGPIYTSDLQWLSSLNAAKSNISDITGVEYCVSLRALNIGYNDIINISPLTKLTKLIDLRLEYNEVHDISPLTNLTNLTELHLDHNFNIRDLSPLANLTKLTYLGLGFNKITDVSDLSGLTKLTYLHLDWNDGLTDLRPLATLTNLTSLRLYHTGVSDLSPLSSLSKLNYISLDQNQIIDISPLASITSLTRLILGGNKISDISPLSSLTNLTILYLEDNRISNISPLTNLSKLNDLRLSGNQIVDISALANLINLTRILIQDNKISDISPLVANIGLSDGDTINISNNPLNSSSTNDYIPQLEARGVEVLWNS